MKLLNILILEVMKMVTLTDLEPNPNNQAFDGTLALWIALGCFLVPIIVLLAIVFVKKIVKAIKFNHKKIVDHDEEILSVKDKYLCLFGEDNINSISKNMTRVSVEVKDLSKVNLDGLRELNVGVLITGNTIKCSSQEFADAIE